MTAQYRQMYGVPYLSSDTSTPYHTVDICEVNLYIHGGGWSDPNIQANSFRDVREHILKEKDVLRHVAGIAAVNYRLSGNPTGGCNARHPDHLDDVQLAIDFLNSRYQFGERYILFGHSAGATLAFQIAMEPESSSVIRKPLAILGASGIYDFRRLVNSIWSVIEYREEYTQMLESAFGPGGFTYGEQNEGSDECSWDLACPAKSTEYESSWPNAQLAMLAHAPDDELVPLEQSTQFAAVLESSLPSGATCHTRFDLVGSHDDIWRKPEQTILLISEVILMLVDKVSI